MSQRKACALLSISRSTVHYQSRMQERDEPLLAAIKELAALYPRYGYRRIQVFLERQGHVMSADKACRLWAKAGLQLPKKRPRKRVAASRPRPQAPRGANEVWPTTSSMTPAPMGSI